MLYRSRVREGTSPEGSAANPNDGAPRYLYRSSFALNDCEVGNSREEALNPPLIKESTCVANTRILLSLQRHEIG